MNLFSKFSTTISLHFKVYNKFFNLWNNILELFKVNFSGDLAFDQITFQQAFYANGL